ncbi:hypothetical protein AB1K54_16080 [Microbacterium sp. BWT-B31]|uniref:hypothetical protein n=1 Tax=Microbacterium sp. BWT-B31 TaxID=3232072 RepID=UPI0035284541
MYFDMGGDWDAAKTRYDLSPVDDMFEFFNRPVPDDAIGANKTIRFTHDPDLRPGSFLSMEARYLERFDCQIVEDGQGGWNALR